jgi:transcriptional regulator with XRE-family HTH domain
MIGDRIEERRKARGLTQAELARRANVPQQTMNGLIKKPYQWSPHLPRIARALGTTIEYLIGEVADPDSNAPAEPELSHEEQKLISAFRSLRSPTRRLVLHLVNELPKDEARDLKGSKVQLPGEGALIPMFEGLLLAMDRSQSVDAQAELLARRLPIGLAQLRDLVTSDGKPIDDGLPSGTIRLEDALPPVDALAQMFAGLLMAMDLAAPVDEQARLLAQRLPTGLSQLQDLQPAAAKGADPKPRRARSTRAPARP